MGLKIRFKIDNDVRELFKIFPFIFGKKEMTKRDFSGLTSRLLKNDAEKINF